MSTGGCSGGKLWTSWGVGEDLGGCQLVEGSTEMGSGREGKARLVSRAEDRWPPI